MKTTTEVKCISSMSNMIFFFSILLQISHRSDLRDIPHINWFFTSKEAELPFVMPWFEAFYNSSLLWSHVLWLLNVTICLYVCTCSMHKFAISVVCFGSEAWLRNQQGSPYKEPISSEFWFHKQEIWQACYEYILKMLHSSYQPTLGINWYFHGSNTCTKRLTNIG